MATFNVSGLDLVVDINDEFVSAKNDKLNISFLDRFGDVNGLTSADITYVQFAAGSYETLEVHFNDKNGEDRYCGIDAGSLYDYFVANGEVAKVGYTGTPLNRVMDYIKDRKLAAKKETLRQSSRISTYIQQNVVQKLQEENAALKEALAKKQKAIAKKQKAIAKKEN